MVEKINILIYIFADLILYFTILRKDELVGEAVLMQQKWTVIESSYLLMILFLSYVFLYFFYIKTKKKKVTICPNLRIIVNVKRCQYIFLTLLIIHFLYYMNTGIGKAGQTGKNSDLFRYSFLFSALQFEGFFGIFYFTCRDKSKLYYSNIIIYIFYKIIQGWTGIILTVFIFEFYCWVNEERKSIRYENIKSVFLAIPAFFVGGYIYSFFKTLKEWIRFGTVTRYTYKEGLIFLAERMSFYETSCAILQNLPRLKYYYGKENVLFREIQEIFKYILPRIFMPNKEWRNINNLFWSVMYEGSFQVHDVTSTYIGIIPHTISIFYVDCYMGFLYIIALAILFVLSSTLIRAFEQKKGQLDMIYFYLLMNIVQVAALGNVFSCDNIRLVTHIFILPIFLLLGGIGFGKSSGTNSG